MKQLLATVAMLAGLAIPCSAQYSQLGAGGGYRTGDSKGGIFYLDGVFHATSYDSKHPVLVLGEVDFTYTRPEHHDTRADLLARLYKNGATGDKLESGLFVEGGIRGDSVNSVLKAHPGAGLGYNYVFTSGYGYNDNQLIIKGDVYGIHGTTGEVSAEYTRPFLTFGKPQVSPFLFKVRARGVYTGSQKWVELTGGISINLTAFGSS